MSRMKEQNLRRFVAIYIAGSLALGGVAYAEEQDQYEEHFLNGTATVINDAAYEEDGVTGGTNGASVDTSSITINSGGNVYQVTGGGYAQNSGAQANVGQAAIQVNGGTVVDLYGGGSAQDGGTANITGKSTITIANGIVENVTGGGFAESGNVSVKESVITISGNSQIGLIQGGGDAEGNNATSRVDKATITINGGTIGIVNPDIEGGPSFGGGYATAAVTQSQTNTSTVGEVAINITNSTFRNSLYGGGGSFEKDEDATTPGQGNATTHVETVNITVGGATKTDGEDTAFYAGGKTSGAKATSTVTNASLTVKDSASLDEVYGGGDSYIGATKVETSKIHLQNNAKVNTVYGGGFSEAGSAEVTNSTISMQDNAKVGTLYGGGESENASATATVTNSTININGGQVGDVYAGGAGANKVTNSTLNISAGKISGNLSATNVTDNKVLNFTQGAGSIVDGTISGYDTATVKQGATTTLTGAAMAADASHSFTSLTVEQQGTLNIGGGKFTADIAGAGATKESALNFTAGKGSTIGGTISGFDTVTVANGAKTDWTKNNATHTFGSLTVEEGGEINITGETVTFDFSPVAPLTTYSLRAARAVQNGDFNVNGAVNLAQGSTLTIEHGTVTTAGKGAFVSAVDKSNLTNSGKVAWGTGTTVSGDLQLGFSNVTNAELIAMGETDDFKTLVQNVANTDNLAAGQKIKNARGDIREFELENDPTGLVVNVAPKASTSGAAYYTGVRQGSAYIGHTIVENIHEHTAGLRNGEKADEFWASIRGGSTDVDTHYGDIEVKTQFYQVGYDWDLSANDQKSTIGLYFTKIAGDSTQHGFKNDLDSAYDFGVYGTKEFNGGNYISLIGRYGRIGNALHTDLQTSEWKDKGYGLSMEFGNRNTQGNGLMLEPYIQLKYTHFSAADFNVGATRVGMDSDSMLDGTLGLRLVKQVGDNPNNTFFGGIAYSRGLSGDFSLKDRTNGEKLGGVDNDANAFELTVGMNRQISACSTVNLNAKKEFGDYDGWSLEGRIQVAF